MRHSAALWLYDDLGLDRRAPNRHKRTVSTAMSILAGLVGEGISQSLSPRLHEAEAEALGIAMVYRAIEVDGPSADLGQILRAAKMLGFNGLNITHPFKQAVIPHLDGLSPDAAILGAVNTVVFEPEGPRGDNTDWLGFAASLRQDISPDALKTVAQIGAGGAGAAVAYALLKAGVALLKICDVDWSRAEALADRMAPHFPNQRVIAAADAATALDGAQGVAQASPVGMDSHPGLPFDPELLHPAMWLIDIIYFPRETALLKAAWAKGCHAINGLGMVAFQGAAAFELFTGTPADPKRILRHLTSLGA